MRLLVLATLAVSAFGQLAPFNAAGVTMGHHHIMVPDVEAQKRIWVDVLGGELSGAPPLEFVKFPGVFLILSQGKGSEGSEGSALESITFLVRDLKKTVDKLRAAGIKHLLWVEDWGLLTAVLPDGPTVRFVEAPDLLKPIEHLGISIGTENEGAESSWWSKVFGAEIKFGWADAIVPGIPGAELYFHKIDAPAAETKGRSLDHTGVNVKNVNEYCAKLSGLGITCERPMGPNTPIAMVTSPAGVRVEINQGLELR